MTGNRVNRNLKQYLTEHREHVKLREDMRKRIRKSQIGVYFQEIRRCFNTNSNI